MAGAAKGYGRGRGKGKNVGISCQQGDCMRIINLGRFRKAVIKAGILLDGTGGQAQEDVDILITGGVVRGIEPSLSEGSSYISPGEDAASVLKISNIMDDTGFSPPGADQREERAAAVDCGGLAVLPGLVDCHVHLALDGVNSEAAPGRRDNEEGLQNHLQDSLEKHRISGILAVRDGGDRNMFGLAAARAARETAVLPLVMATGQALRKKGMYGSFLGRGLDPADIKDAVRETAKAGAGQLKVLVTGIVSFREYGKVGSLQWSREELSLIVAEAHEAGLKVMAHANSDQGTALAVRCGVDSLEHGYFISQETLERMAGKGIAWVPTIVPVAAQLEEPCRHKHTRAQLAVIERTYRRQQLMVEKARALGVTVGVGTDAGAPGVGHGVSFLEELKLLVEAGFSTADAINAATANGANILGLEKAGRVTPGMPVCLIGVRGNPLADLDVLKKPEVILACL